MTDCNNPPDLTFGYTNSPPGPYVPPYQCLGTLDLSTSDCAQSDAAYVAGLMAEALNIAAGPVNVFMLLGTYSQGSTVDAQGTGYPITSGTNAGFNAADVFNTNLSSWQSSVTGAAVTSTPAYIGYNFGTKKALLGGERYADPSVGQVRLRISTLKLRQSADPLKRATQIRIDASDDGVNWTRIDVVNAPNNADLNVIALRSMAGFQQWRLVPVFFTGVTANNPWEVNEIHLVEANQVSLDTIEDPILLENRDRSYATSSTMIKCDYDLLDVQTELAKFGISLPQTYVFTCSFVQMVTILGRPVITGDILELPGELQYDQGLRPARKFLEVTDTNWATQGYTFNWKPNLFRFYATPLVPSVESKDITGSPNMVNMNQTDSDLFVNGFLQNPMGADATQAIEQTYLDAVPLDGGDGSGIASGRSLNGPAGTYDGRDLYVEDAVPPDGITYTSGDNLPVSTQQNPIADGTYFRLTYTNVAQNLRPPEKLLKYDAANSRWYVVEKNHRAQPTSAKRTINKFLESGTQFIPDTKI